MSVASRNMFAILNDDATESSAPTSAPAKGKAAPQAPAPAKDTKRTGPASRGGKYYNRGGGPKPTTRDDSANDVAGADGPKEERRRDREHGDRGRGRGRGRGGGGGGGGGRGRTYDRHSATGIVDSEKKLHQSWGGDTGNSELAAEKSGAADAEAALSPSAGGNDWGTTGDADAGWGAPEGEATTEAKGAAEGAPAEGAERRRPVEEEEDNTMTLEEYLKSKKDSEIIPKLEGGRAANEGSDSSLWKGAVELKKDEESNDYFVGKVKAPPKPRTKKEEKITIEIDARFDPPSRGGRGRGSRGGDRGGDRGARGGGRGGRGRGQENGRRGAPQNVDVEDKTAFPALGA